MAIAGRLGVGIAGRTAGWGALIIGARRLPRNLGRVANALCLGALRGHWPRRATRIACACFALGLRGCGRQFGAGNLRRGPITEAWARRGRCLPLAALTGASDAQETWPGEAKRDFPGLSCRSRRSLGGRGGGAVEAWSEGRGHCRPNGRLAGRGLGARHRDSARIRAPRRAAGPAFCREALRGRGPPAGRWGVPSSRRGYRPGWREAPSQTAPCLHY